MIKEKFPQLHIKQTNTGNIFTNYIQYRKLLGYIPNFLKNLDSDLWIILGCGPSLELFQKDKDFYEILKKYPVVSIKSAGEKFEDVTNIQLFNEVRYHPSFSKIGNYRLSVSNFTPESKTHIHFPIMRYSLNSSLYRTNDYEKKSLENSFFRPWGVGIFYELAIFVPLLFRAKKIILCGIDMNNKGKYHFYDKKKSEDSDFYQVSETEFFFTKGTSYYLMYWLKKKGVQLANLSPLSELPLPKFNSVSELNNFIVL